MLLHIARNDDLIIELEDFEKAIALLKQVEMKLPQTFAAIGKNPYTVDMNRIIAYIKEKGRVQMSEIRARFYHAATPSMLNELVQGLADMGLIVQHVEGMQTFITMKLIEPAPISSQ